MKRRIALLLVLVLALTFVLASCGKKCETHTDADIDEVCDVCGEAVPFTPTYLGFEGIYNTQYENDEAEKAVAAAALALTLTDDYSFYVDGKFVFFTNSGADAGEAKTVVYNVETGAQVKTLYKEKSSWTVAELEKPESERPIRATVFRSITTYDACGTQFLVETARDVSDDKNYYNPYMSNDESKWTYTKTLYTATGDKVAEVKLGNSSGYMEELFTEVSDTLFVFDGKVYDLKDDKATAKFDLGFKYIVDADVETDKYLYEFEEEYGMMSEMMDMETVGAVNIYNKTFDYVTSYRKPADADQMNAFVLSNGNVLIQLITELPEDATEYDYLAPSYKYGVTAGEDYFMNVDIVNDAKFDVKTLVFDVEAKTATEVAFDYLVGEYYNGMFYGYEDAIASEATSEYFTETFVSGKIDNFASLVKFDGTRLDAKDQVYVNLRSTDLKVLGFLGQEIADQDGIARLIDTNRFRVYDKAGNCYLLNEKGEVLGNITNAYTTTVDGTKFIVNDDDHNRTKLYDMSLNLVVNFNDIDYKWDTNSQLWTKSYKVTNEDQSVTTKTDYYAYYAGAFHKIAVPEKIDDIRYDNGVIVYSYEEKITNEDQSVTSKYYDVLCNAKGEEIFKNEQIESETTVEGVTTWVENDIDWEVVDGKVYIEVVTETTKSNSSNVEYKYELYIAK